MNFGLPKTIRIGSIDLRMAPELPFLFLFCVPFLMALGDSSIWDANEAFYVQTPIEMLERGDLIVPYFNGEPRLNKPPLSYWLVAGLYKIFGVSVLVQRLLIASLACASVFATYRIGRLLFEDARIALWGAGAFAMTFRFLILSRRLLIDVLLLLCILLAVAFFLDWCQRKGKSSYLLFSLCAGLAFLAKGPVGLLPLVFLGLFLIGSGRWRELGQAPWRWGALLTASVAAFWFLLLAWRLGLEPVWAFLVTENLGRFSHLDFGPERGCLYYVGVFFTDFAPWSFLFPFGLFWSLGGHSRPETKPWKEAWLLLGSWIATYLAVFSLSHNKQEYYILPLYPAAALWIAAYLRSGRTTHASRMGATASMLLAVALIAMLVSAILPSHDWWINSWRYLPLLFLLLAAALIQWRRYTAGLCSMALFYALSFQAYIPELEAFKPIRPLALRILSETAKEGREEAAVGYYRLTSPSLAFYLGRPVVELYDPEEALKVLESSHPAYLIMQAGDYETLSKASKQPLQIVDVRPKLYTTARNLSRVLRKDRKGGAASPWTRPVYLVTNQRGE